MLDEIPLCLLAAFRSGRSSAPTAIPAMGGYLRMPVDVIHLREPINAEEATVM